jgi:predicted aconitase
MIQPVAGSVPVVTAELSENDCAHGYIDSYMAWADTSGVSYLGSAWEAWANACASGPALITAFDGSATNFGIGLRDHLAVLGSR